MSALNSLLGVLVAIGVGIALGQLLFRRHGAAGVGLYAGFATITGTVWFIAAVFLIIGGFRITGLFLVMVAWYLVQSNSTRFKEETGGLRNMARNL